MTDVQSDAETDRAPIDYIATAMFILWVGFLLYVGYHGVLWFIEVVFYV